MVFSWRGRAGQRGVGVVGTDGAAADGADAGSSSRAGSSAATSHLPSRTWRTRPYCEVDDGRPAVWQVTVASTAARALSGLVVGGDGLHTVDPDAAAGAWDTAVRWALGPVQRSSSALPVRKAVT